MSATAELTAIAGAGRVLSGRDVRPYLQDATESRGLRGEALAVALPGDAETVRAVVAWAYGHDVPLTPQGGRTGFAGGAVPDGGIVVALDELGGAPVVEPEQWRMRVRAGTTTRTVQRLARENGLYYPPDPGAAEQSQIG